MLHSFGDHAGRDIILALRGRFDGQQGIPVYNELDEVKWFVVGGSPVHESVVKAVQLVTILRDWNLPVLGVRFTTAPEYEGKSKAVVITADGQVSWTFS